jgi:hypothetical protein
MGKLALDPEYVMGDDAVIVEEDERAPWETGEEEDAAYGS